MHFIRHPAHDTSALDSWRSWHDWTVHHPHAHSASRRRHRSTGNRQTRPLYLGWLAALVLAVVCGATAVWMTVDASGGPVFIERQFDMPGLIGAVPLIFSR